MDYKKRNIRIIILSGKARSGKNKVASLIKENIKNKKTIILSYAFYIKEYAKNISSWDGSEFTKPRTLLQNLGVELIKTKIDDKLLIRRMLEDIEVYSYFYDYIIISDARFVDEINCIKEKYDNVITINIIGKSNDLNEIEKNHITETALDQFNNYDYVIENNGNIDELKKKVSDINYGEN